MEAALFDNSRLERDAAFLERGLQGAVTTMTTLWPTIKTCTKCGHLCTEFGACCACGGPLRKGTK